MVTYPNRPKGSSITVDFSEEILGYLREHRGQPVRMLTMLDALAKRVVTERVAHRGKILSDLSRLIREEKVFRYRNKSVSPRQANRWQGLLRISEKYA